MIDSQRPILQLEAASVTYALGRPLPFAPQRKLTAVQSVDLALHPQETVGVIGESGCGKSSLGRLLAGLEKPSEGTLYYDGVDVATLDKAGRRQMRRNIQVVFQDPAGSLNPRKTVQQIIEEPFDIHPDLAAERSKADQVRELLGTVGLKQEHAHRYPHELSGGQQQRVGIARALAVRPRVLICDEAVSALDVSVRAQVVNLLRDLQQRFGLAYVFIAHDLQVVRNMCHRVMVMYLGQCVEVGDTAEVYDDTAHPYTQALLAAAPELRYAGEVRHAELVEGDPPSALQPPTGCRFRPRCRFAVEACSSPPPLEDFAEDHQVRCIRAADVNEYSLGQETSESEQGGERSYES